MQMTGTAAILAARVVGATVFALGDARAAQKYPDKSIRMIVPYAPGGGSDISARIIGIGLNELLATTVVVDNRPGASGRPRAVNRVPACGMRTSASRDARRWT